MHRATICFAVLFATTTALAQPIPKPPELDAWIEAGDPRAVPIILDRLRQAEARSHDDDTDRFYMANMVSHAAKYRLDEAGPLMVRLFSRPSDELDAIIHAASLYRTEAAVGLQRALLADPRVDEGNGRSELLVALAEMGDDKAADALAEWTIAELAAGAPTNLMTHYTLVTAVPTTRSKRFVERINAAPLPTQPPPEDISTEAETARRLRQWLEWLRVDVAVANGSVDAIVEFVGTAEREKIARVDHAFIALGKFGKPEDAARLQMMRLGKEGCFDRDPRIESCRRRAIAEIKRRHWKHFANTATSQPAR